MANKMLIDASHPEETRVVVVRGNRIEEFDFESENKKQLKGNIYLARVTRVEPSLQAAFVEYGGNRHGFLAFSEIHPDYYQIPIADRQALLRAEAEAAQTDEEDEDRAAEQSARGGRRRGQRSGGRTSRAKASDAEAPNDEDETETLEAKDVTAGSEEAPEAEDTSAAEPGDTDNDDNGPPRTMAAETEADVVSEPAPGDDVSDPAPKKRARRSRRKVGSEAPDSDNGDENNGDSSDEDDVENVGAEDALEELPSRRKLRRDYKIQEVVKRRQILLVQVVKEERGNKGAALTTYMSLAGRYSVLMPNTARGGGISRKITSAQDRRRLKDIVKELEVPTGMGVILRTAGANRTRAEVKRDYDYLMRLWETVRTLTLQSAAPALVYEEGSLIKRSIRDLYNKDIDEIQVAGEEGYKEAKSFMRMLMPSHAKVVQPYRDPTPIYARNGIEAQLDRMLQPQVTLKSGGYIIINQTEALVAIDVNSGRSTKEHSIENTALQTNLEAAEEVSRHLRLRDLAGLIVIDFIDMMEKRNNRAVEKRLKDCLKSDRARIQVGRISPFGLLEMSRQRIRASMLESTMQMCEHCNGTGHIRSNSSTALYLIRAIEEYLLKDAANDITVRTPIQTALYVLNHKRINLLDLEGRFGAKITIEGDDSVGVKLIEIIRGGAASLERTSPAIAPDFSDIEEEDDVAVDVDVVEATEDDDGDSETGRKRRRRRKRRGGRDGEERRDEVDASSDGDDAKDAEGESADGEIAAGDGEEDTGPRKKRRRGKRGGRRNRRGEADETTQTSDGSVSADADSDATGETPSEVTAVSDDSAPTDTIAEAAVVSAPETAVDAGEAVDVEVTPKPVKKPRKSRARAKKTDADATVTVIDIKTEEATGDGEDGDVAAPAPIPNGDAAAETIDEAAALAVETPKPRRAPRRKKVAEAETAAAPPEASEPVETSEPVVTSETPEEAPAETKPRKGGWWQRRGFL